MKKTTAVILTVLFALVLLCSCGSNEQILGKWETVYEGETVAFEFKSDGSFVTCLDLGITLTGHYSVSGSKIDSDAADFIAMSVDKSFKLSGEFILEGDKLTFAGKDGSADLVLTRAAE